ncbi:hypothetical protein ACOMHN_022819 [Nucella lapillus]
MDAFVFCAGRCVVVQGMVSFQKQVSGLDIGTAQTLKVTWSLFPAPGSPHEGTHTQSLLTSFQLPCPPSRRGSCLWRMLTTCRRLPGGHYTTLEAEKGFGG